jgi:hypothetical protein
MLFGEVWDGISQIFTVWATEILSSYCSNIYMYIKTRHAVQYIDK